MNYALWHLSCTASAPYWQLEGTKGNVHEKANTEGEKRNVKGDKRLEAHVLECSCMSAAVLSFKCPITASTL